MIIDKNGFLRLENYHLEIIGFCSYGNTILKLFKPSSTGE